MKKKATDSYIFFDKADERKCDEKDCNDIETPIKIKSIPK